MSEKMGEGVIQSAFADHLTRRAIKSLGNSAPYVNACLQGKSDRQFADYFASVNSICILLEFKEFENEFSHEKRKPLRDDLCSLLIGDKYSAEESLASRGHFLACGDIQGKIENIHSYPKKVCPFFEIHHNFSGSSYTEKDFLSGFINKSVGISIEEMNTYVTLLAKIAQQGRAQSKCPEFKAILLSYDCRDSDDYKKQPFNDLCELKEIMDMAMNYVNDLTDGPRLM
jgi:hypothetical protein